MVSKEAGMVMTAAFIPSPVCTKFFSSFSTIADSCMGVTKLAVEGTRKLSLDPIFRLKEPNTLPASLLMYSLALSPTMVRSPRKATTDGRVSLWPIGFLKICTAPFSNLATSELVVPRSIPKLIKFIRVRLFYDNDRFLNDSLSTVLPLVHHRFNDLRDHHFTFQFTGHAGFTIRAGLVPPFMNRIVVIITHFTEFCFNAVDVAL